MSDQSLRDALEKVLATTDGWAVSNETLLGLLAAHPAEPAPETVHLIEDGEAVTSCCGRAPFELPRWERITVGAQASNCSHPAEPAPDRHPSDPTVEAAAAAACEAMYPPNPSGRVKVHDSWGEIEEWERDAWRATAAAALKAAYRVDAPRPLLDREEVGRAFRREAGPWLTANRDAVTDAATDAVMELARPMPTREELAAAGHRWSCLKRDEPVHELDAIDYDRADEILEIWALLNGAES